MVLWQYILRCQSTDVQSFFLKPLECQVGYWSRGIRKTRNGYSRHTIIAYITNYCRSASALAVTNLCFSDTPWPITLQNYLKKNLLKL